MDTAHVPWPMWMGRFHRTRNRLALHLAGRAGSLVDLEHVGRRSGVTRHTPVRAFRRDSTVAIGANFGGTSDWVRNILAADECWLTMRGTRIHLVGPRLVGLEEAAWAFPWWFRTILRRLVRTEQCLVLSVA
ncbi:MAG: nitroreductase family deazaflavin-dependent oxidoreductase [Tetrasphaera sp.]